MIMVVGSLNLDLFIETPRLPAPGETILGERFRQEPGGKGANQAFAAARLGSRVAMIGAVGRDVFGQQLVSGLQGAGVDTEGVVFREDATTGTAFIVVDAAGQNQIVVAPGANALLTGRHVEQSASRFQKAKVVMAQLEIPLEAVAAALRLARAHGALTILNPAPFAPLPDELLRQCDWIIPNEQEAAQLVEAPSGQPQAAVSPALAARRLRERAGGAGVVITLGASGAWLESAPFSGQVQGFRVEAVDTVGAGDTFIGAFAARLTEGAAPAEAARFACAAAALSVTRRGAQGSVPSRAEVERFLDQHP